MSELEFVGHVVNEKGLTRTREKIENDLQIPPPEKRKDVISVLGGGLLYMYAITS